MSRLALRQHASLPFKFITIAVSVIVTVSVVAMPMVSADQYDDQINALNQQNGQNQAALGSLQAQAATLADQIAALQAQISQLQAQIRDNQARQADLAAKIIAAQAELDQEKKTLGDDIKAMYLGSQTSTLEMLASSQNLSSFFDKAQYRDIVQAKVRTALDKVTALKAQLTTDKATVDKLLTDQTAMNGQLGAQQAQVNQLLSLNEGQQADYNATIAANNSKIGSLRVQQAIENAKGFLGSWKTGGSGGYPWAGAPWPNEISDPWGMYMRQCVSYTAWKVANSGRFMPFWGGVGNANQWPGDARAAGIAVDGNPKVGDVAISMAGSFGHAMYVEGVNGDGTITVSQYNAGWDGLYSVGKRYSAGLLFIHF